MDTLTRVKAGLGVLLVCGAAAYAAHRWSQLHPAGINNGVTGFGPPRMVADARPKTAAGAASAQSSGAAGSSSAATSSGLAGLVAKMAPVTPGEIPQEIVAQAGLTPDQVAKLKAIREKTGGDFVAMRREADKVITPEQRVKIRDAIRSRIETRAQRAMSPQDFAAFRTRIDEQIQRVNAQMEKEKAAPPR